MTIYLYSASTNQFYPTVLIEAYRANNTLPDDVQPIDDDMALEFLGVPPEGMKRVAGSDGLPTWKSNNTVL
ncbi:hypothetical protein F0327_25145 [Citrobacter braakii]|nr:hypothetical protein F0327_25145 [Citrobacter braakii]